MNNKQFSKKPNLYSADFESLYTKIPLKETIPIICDFVPRENIEGITAYVFHIILKLVLEDNFFRLKENFFRLVIFVDCKSSFIILRKLKETLFSSYVF